VAVSDPAKVVLKAVVEAVVASVAAAAAVASEEVAASVAEAVSAEEDNKNGWYSRVMPTVFLNLCTQSMVARQPSLEVYLKLIDTKDTAGRPGRGV